MGCCHELAERFILLISILMLVMALIAMGFGAYIAATIGGSLDGLGFGSVPVISAVFGALLFVFAIVGIVGSLRDSQCLLYIYLILTMLLALAVLASGITLLVKSGALDNVGQNNAVDFVEGSVEETSVTFELALFQACCPGVDAADVDRCNDSPKNPQFCVSNEDLFASLIAGLGSDTTGICSVFADLGVDSADCGSEETFCTAANDLINDNINELGIVNLVVGIIIFLMLFATCYLLCSTKNEEQK